MPKDYEVVVTKDEKTGVETSTIVHKSSTKKKVAKKSADESEF